MFKTFSGTEAEMQALAVSFTLNVTKNYYYYVSSYNKTYAGFSYNFQWYGAPIIQASDIIAFVWSEGFYFTGGRIQKVLKIYITHI